MTLANSRNIDMTLVDCLNAFLFLKSIFLLYFSHKDWSIYDWSKTSEWPGSEAVVGNNWQTTVGQWEL